MSVMAAMRWVWHELTRPRGSVSHPFYRVTRRSRAGVALLMAISSILLLAVLVTEIAHGAVVRAQLAAQHRDEVKAEALAYSGLQIYRMLLMASAALGRNPMIGQLAQGMGVNATELWQAIPFIDTRFLRLLFANNGSVDQRDVNAAVAAGGLSEEDEAASREGNSLLGKAFLDFDGDFHASVKDIERKIYVGQMQAQSMADLLLLPQAQQLLAMMSTEQVDDYIRENNLVKEELIGNLADWTDVDDTRIFQGGSEDAIYQTLEPPYRSKNAPFDTRQELRLVDGWHLDGLWQHVGQHLTIYGTGKINVNTASQDVIKGLLLAYAEGPVTETTADDALRQFFEMRGRPLAEGGLFITNANAFVSFFETQLAFPLRDEISDAITTESKIFRVTSAGEVGTARVEIQAVIDFSTNNAGQILYWRVR